MNREDAMRALSRCYGLIPSALENATPAVFRCNFPEGQTLFLKKLDPLFHAKADALTNLYTSIAEAGLTPPLRPDLDGLSFPSFEGHRLVLQYAAESVGHVDQSRNAETSPRLAEALARLHKVMRQAPDDSNLISQFEQRVDYLAEFASQLGIPEGGDILAITASLPRQKTHGDVHTGNVLIGLDRVLFLDFDSACLASPRAEAAFTAFRFFSSLSDQKKFLDSYVTHSNEETLNIREMHAHIFHIILMRVHFIINAVAKNEYRFLSDLPAQMQRLNAVRHAINEDA